LYAWVTHTMEIEVKILNINKADVVRTLHALGAKKTFEGTVHSYFYDFDDKRLGHEDKILRIRMLGQTALLTLKKRVSKKKAKIMHEHEIRVSDRDILMSILSDLGLSVWDADKKTRTSYELDTVHVDIDTIPGIPSFLEIEAPNLQTLKDYVKKLGFSMKHAKPWSRQDLLDHYQH